MITEYIIELPERIDVCGAENIPRVGVTRAESGDRAVRNYLFRNLGRDVARVVASKLAENGGRERFAYMVPEIAFSDGGKVSKDDKFYAFLNEISGGKNPSREQAERARSLWKKAYGKTV